MDKYTRNKLGYKTDWEDGHYDVVNIVFDVRDDKEKFKRTVLIEDGLVKVGGYNFKQSHFFEVNHVLQKIN